MAATTSHPCALWLVVTAHGDVAEFDTKADAEAWLDVLEELGAEAWVWSLEW